MNQNDPYATPSGITWGITSLPTELLLEILSQTLAPDHFGTIVIQETPRRRQRLYGPREAYLITARARCNLRQVSKLFKELVDAHPDARRVVSIDQASWSRSKLNSFSFPSIISGKHDLSSMHLLLDLNSTANFLIATRRLLLPQLVSLSIRIIESSATTRLFLGARLHILPIISKAYPGLIDLHLRNTESDRHDFVGWSSDFPILNLPKLQRLLLHSTPASLSWTALDTWNSSTFPSLRHLSLDSVHDLYIQDIVGQRLGTSLLTLSIHTSVGITPTFWSTFSALQELRIVRSSSRDVMCDSPPPALHPIRRVVIRGGWPSNPDIGSIYIVDRLYKFTERPSPVEWLICDGESINTLNQTQWRQYKNAILSHTSYPMCPEVRQEIVEKWVTREGMDEGDPHRLALFER